MPNIIQSSYEVDVKNDILVSSAGLQPPRQELKLDDRRYLSRFGKLAEDFFSTQKKISLVLILL
jgi:hypothetical protein